MSDLELIVSPFLPPTFIGTLEKSSDWALVSSCSVNIKVLLIYSLVHFTNIRQVLVAPKVGLEFSIRCYGKTQYLVAD